MRRIVVLAALLAFARPAFCQVRTWDGGPAGTGNDVNTAANWSSDTLPVAAGTALFSNLGPLDPTQSAAFSVRNMTFDTLAPAYTYNANGFNLSLSGGANSGVIANNSAFTQVINMGGGLLTVGATAGNTSFAANEADIVFNGRITPGGNLNSSSSYLNFTGAPAVSTNPTRDVYINVDSTIHPLGQGNIGGVNDWGATTANSSTRGVTYIECAGRVYLGDIGTAYLGRWVLDGATTTGPGGSLRLTHNNSLGGVTSTRVYIGLTAAGGGGAATQNTTLEFSNNISVTKFAMFMEPRNGVNNSADPHILNVSGNNTFTLTADWNTSSNESGNWNIQSDTGKLTIAGGNFYATGTGNTILQLRGAGDGQFDCPLVTWTNNSPSIPVVKSGTGTWTFTNIPFANGSTIFDVPTLNQTSIWTGSFTVLGGTLALSGTTTLSSGTGVDIRAGAIFDVTGLAGGLVLNPANLMIKGAGTINGSLTAGTSNTIAPGDSAIGTLTINGGLTLAGGSTLQFKLSNTSTTSGGTNDRIALTGAAGNLSLAGSTTVNITPTGGSLGNGSYLLISYTGTLTGDATNLNLTGLPVSPRQTFAASTATSGQVNLVVTGSAANLTWVGGVNGNTWVDGLIDSNSINWTGHPTDNHFYNGDNVTFTSTGTNSPVINGIVSPGTTNFTNGVAQSYTISGGTLNAANMNFSGSGSVNFSNASTVVSNALSVTGSGNIEIAGSSSFVVGTSFTKGGSGSFTFSNTGGLISLPTIVAVNSGTLVLNRDDDVTVTNGFTGAGSLRKDNINTVTLSGNNSGFSGTITVTNGTLKTGSTTALGGAAANTTIQNGATLDLNGAILASGTVTVIGTGFNGGGVVTNNHPTIDALIPNVILAGDTTFAAPAAHGYNLGSYFGAGVNDTGIFNGGGFNVTFNILHEVDIKNVDNMNVNNLTISGAQALYFAGSVIPGPNTGSILIQDGARLGIYGSGSNNGFDTFTATLTKPIVIVNSAGGSGIEIYNGNGTIDSPITLNGKLSVESHATVNGTWSTTFKGPITGTGELALHSRSSGTSRFSTVILTSDGNTYSGPTTIGGGGGFNNIAAASDRITGLFIGDGGSTGSIGPGDISIIPAGNTLNTALFLNRTGTYTLPNNIIMNGNGNVARVRTLLGDPTLSGVISGNGRVVVNAGNLTLSGANTYTGITEVFTGHLTLTNNSALGLDGTNNIGYVEVYGAPVAGADDTAAILLTGNITVTKAAYYLVHHTTNAADVGPHLINLSGNNELTGTICTDSDPNATNRFITFQSNSGNMKFSGEVRQDHTGTSTLTLRGAGNGEISGAITQPGVNFFDGSPVTGNVLNVNKEDAGTWKLSGLNSYTGTTTVNHGALSITGDSSGATGAVLVNGGDGTGGTLKGTGIVGGPVAVTGGSGAGPTPGKLRGGNSIGTLTLAQGFALGAGAQLVVEIGGPAVGASANTGASTDLGNLPNPTRNSFLHVTGGLTGIDASALIAVDGTGATFAPGTSYSFLVADGAGPQSFSITNANQFTFTNINANPNSVSLTGDASGNIYLNFSTVAIPEPALLGVVVMGVLALRRWK